MVRRQFWEHRIESAWRERNVLWLSGVRRAGKTFLAQSLSDADYRGQGVGQQLILAARERRGAGEWLEVGTQAHNLAAVRLYEEAGVRQVATYASYRKWLR